MDFLCDRKTETQQMVIGCFDKPRPLIYDYEPLPGEENKYI